MQKIGVLLALVALLLPCLAFAQDEDVAMDQGFRARVGWFDMGDADNGLGIGVDYMFPLLGQQWMAGFEWGDGSYDAIVIPDTAAFYDTLSIDVWDFNLNWIGKVKSDKYSWYYGGGLGWYRVEGDVESDDCIGFQVLAGLDFATNWSADVRYVFGTDFNDADIDGLRVSVGYWFK